MLGVPMVFLCVRTLSYKLSSNLGILYAQCREKCRELRSESREESGLVTLVSHPSAERQQSGQVPPPIVQVAETSTGNALRHSSAPAAEASTPHRELNPSLTPSRCECQPSLPLPLFLLLTLSYCGLGAALYSHCERWSLLDGSYFAVLTLATVGFGGLLPRALREPSAHYGRAPLWLVELTYAAYTLLGLVVLRAALELTRARLAERLSRTARSLGLLPERGRGRERAAPKREERGTEYQKEEEAGMQQERGQQQRNISLEKIRLALPGRAGRPRSGAGSRSPSLRSALQGSVPPSSADASVLPSSAEASALPSSAEASGRASSTEASSAESVLRPPRPKSARPRRPEYDGEDD